MKQPAYAKSLNERRRAGEHPEHVVVIYGNDWYVGEGITRLAVKPGQALGLSWAAVAGLPVKVLDRTRDGEREDYLELYHLLGEIARTAASVHVTSAAEGLHEREVGELAFAARGWDGAARQVRWPAWWSDELEQLHGQNTERWLAEITQALCA